MIVKRNITLFFFLFLICIFRANANDVFLRKNKYQESEIAKGNYIVIGAFKYERNAKKQALIALKRGFNGRYFFNESRDLYYVYVHKFKRKKRAYRITRRIQSYKLFDDTWVFSVGEDDSKNMLRKEQDIVPVDINDTKDGFNTSDEFATGDKEVLNKSKKELKEEKRKRRKEKKSKEQESTEPIVNTISSDSSLIDNIEATEKLKQADVGESIVFNQFLFHKSSAILKSKARADLTALANYLKNNPAVKILINGHTNGKFKGNIFLLRSESDKYFSLNRKNIIVKGNEKTLSEERALLIKRFLVDFGIDEDRIKVKGWGAKKMLYPKEHFKSAQNRRVEIEILEK